MPGDWDYIYAENERLRTANAELASALRQALDAFDKRSHGGRVGWEEGVYQHGKRVLAEQTRNT